MEVAEAVARALDIGPDSSAAEHTIDITTLGGRSGIPRVSQRQNFDDWLAGSPLVEIVFDDEELRMAPPRGKL